MGHCQVVITNLTIPMGGRGEQPYSRANNFQSSASAQPPPLAFTSFSFDGVVVYVH